MAGALLDALGLDETALAGNSMGGTWTLWYALAHPDRIRRLVLLGAAPLLPATRVPAPLRVMAAPRVGEFLQRLMPSTAKTVVQMMGFMGEKETIAAYPDQINALVAAGNDPVASKANLAELRAVAGPFGFRRRLRLHADELRRLSVPTLLGPPSRRTANAPPGTSAQRQLSASATGRLTVMKSCCIAHRRQKGVTLAMLHCWFGRAHRRPQGWRSMPAARATHARSVR